MDIPTNTLIRAVCSPPIRVAFVVHTFDTGGQERCIATLVNQIPAHLIDATIISFQKPGAAVDWIERPNVRVVSLNKRRANDPRLVQRLAQAFKQHKVDVAHSHNWGTLFETSLACKYSRVAHVHAEHGLEYSNRSTGFRALLRNRLKRHLYRRTDALVAIANCVRNRLIHTFGCLPRHIQLIANGVPTPRVTDKDEHYADLRRKLKIASGSLIAGSVGRLAPVKGFSDALCGFKQLSDRLPACHMVIVGDGPEKPALQALCSKLDIRERVHLVGHQADIGYWLSGFDLFFNSSRSEAMNLAILEAMSLRLPILATDVGDSAEVIRHNVGGIICPPGDVEGFAHSLSELFANREKRIELGNNALTLYEQSFTVDRMLSKYASLYYSVQARSDCSSSANA